MLTKKVSLIEKLKDRIGLLIFCGGCADLMSLSIYLCKKAFLSKTERFGSFLFCFFYSNLAHFFLKMTAKDVKEITYMPLVTFFSFLERPGKNRKGGLQQSPLVRRGLNKWINNNNNNNNPPPNTSQSHIQTIHIERKRIRLNQNSCLLM